jgi:hypothetical protein
MVAELFRRNDWQHDVRWMIGVVMDGIEGRHLAAMIVERLARVRIDVEAWKVAA